MAPLNSMIDLTKLRPGVKVRLGGQETGPVKPYPVGWVEVVDCNWEIGTLDAMLRTTESGLAMRVVGDDRWVPVALIEELREP